MKKEDPTIAEIRAVRLAISEKFGHDPEKIAGKKPEIKPMPINKPMHVSRIGIDTCGLPK